MNQNFKNLVTNSLVMAGRKVSTLQRPVVNVRCSDGLVRKAYNGVVISNNALVLYKPQNLALVSRHFTTIFKLNNWGLTTKIERQVSVSEFSAYLNSLSKVKQTYDITKSLAYEMKLLTDYPNLAGLREVQNINDLISKEQLSNISRLDNYFYIAIGIHRIISNRSTSSFEKQTELEKFTFQAHLKQLSNDPSFNFTNDTANYILQIEESVAIRLQDIKDLIKDDNIGKLDVDLEEIFPLLKLCFKNITPAELANYLVNWCIDLYKEEFMSDGNENLKSTRLHFNLGRAVYKKGLNTGKSRWSEKKTFTEYLETLDPIHTKIYDKVIDSRFNYDQLTSVLGCLLIDILRKIKVLTQNKFKQSNKDFYYINTSTQFKDKIGIVNMTAARIPTTFPMVHPPKLWDIDDSGKIERYGGYLWNNKFGRSDLWYNKELYSNTTELWLDENKSNALIRLLNGLGRTPYRINKPVLDFIIENNDKLNIFIPYDSNVKNIKKGKFNEENVKIRDKSRIDFTTIILGLVYSYTDKFFLPVKADFINK